MLTLLQRGVAGFGAFATVAVGVCAWPYTVDDAYIVARYATRVASGMGYTLSGNVASDGVTGPLWLLPGIVATLCGVSPVVAAKVVGLLLMAAAVGLVLARQRRRWQGGALVALLLLVCQPTMGTWGVAGLETGAATFSLCSALLAVTARPRARPWHAGFALAALPWLRPELVLGASVLLIALARRVGVRAWPAWALACLSVLTVCGFRFMSFGDAIPLSFHAKHGTLSDGAGYALRAVFVLAGGLGVVPVGFAWWRGRSDDRIAVLVLVAHVVAVLVAGGDWMPGFRLFAPVLPVYVALCAVGVQRMGLVSRALAVIALAFACSVPLLDLVTRVPELRIAGATRETAGAALALHLRAHARRVALVDIGYLGYRSGLEVVDLGGVTDPEIARLPGGHLDKRLPLGWLQRRAPDAIVLHSASPPTVDAHGGLLSLDGYPVERRAMADSWVRARFAVANVVAYSPRYHYVVLLPRAGRPFPVPP